MKLTKEVLKDYISLAKKRIAAEKTIDKIVYRISDIREFLVFNVGSENIRIFKDFDASLMDEKMTLKYDFFFFSVNDCSWENGDYPDLFSVPVEWLTEDNWEELIAEQYKDIIERKKAKEKKKKNERYRQYLELQKEFGGQNDKT